MMEKSPTHDSRQEFSLLLEKYAGTQGWLKLVLTKYRGKEPELQRLTIRSIQLQKGPALSFVYSYKTRDLTKNHPLSEGLSLIQALLDSDFKNAHLFTVDGEIQLETSKKGKFFLRHHSIAATHHQSHENGSGEHNRSKKRFVDLNRHYLTALGITDTKQQLIPAMSAKWKQLNKFVEIFDHALNTATTLPAGKPLQVVDFGSGKGYLTFSLYDHLHHVRHNPAKVIGIELRNTLVTLCNQIAEAIQYHDLSFVCSDIKHYPVKKCDVMIALHACDTATDHALHYGIRGGASIILCAPCCHKQIRPQLHSPDLLKPMLKYGVHLGQEAEMITDSLRALLLEANGYETKVFEFISLEHTDKNKMILGIKTDKNLNSSKILEQIAAIKGFYGIEEHCLEKLLIETTP